MIKESEFEMRNHDFSRQLEEKYNELEKVNQMIDDLESQNDYDSNKMADLSERAIQIEEEISELECAQSDFYNYNDEDYQFNYW